MPTFPHAFRGGAARRMLGGPVLVLSCLLTLAACGGGTPQRSTGGYPSYEEYLRAREQQLQGQSGTPLSAQTDAAATALEGEETAATPAPGSIGADTLAALRATSGSAGGVTATSAASAQFAASSEMNSPYLMDVPATGDAVPSSAGLMTESIAAGGIGAEIAPTPADPTVEAASPAADAVAAPDTGTAASAPMAAPAATALASAGSGSGPNLAAYALSVSNAPGQQVWSRGGLKLTTAQRACSKFVSPDLAQMTFLQRGGPEKDGLNLDPDGDGFACGWDPRPFQLARQ